MGWISCEQWQVEGPGTADASVIVQKQKIQCPDSEALSQEALSLMWGNRAFCYIQVFT
jgi:hypothetical protein